MKYLSLLIVFLCHFGLAQTLPSVDEVLSKTQESIEKEESYTVNLDYKLFPTRASKEIIESYQGKVINNQGSFLVEINKTIFLLPKNGGNFLKLNKDEEVMLVSSNTKGIQAQSPVEMIKEFVTYFEKKEISLENGQYICTLTTAAYTQLPYVRVVLYINKNSYKLEKQVLYLGVQRSYKDEAGNTKIGNPRLEINLSNYNTKLTVNDKSKTSLATYIIEKNAKLTPVGEYAAYNLINN